MYNAAMVIAVRGPLPGGLNSRHQEQHRGQLKPSGHWMGGILQHGNMLWELHGPTGAHPREWTDKTVEQGKHRPVTIRRGVGAVSACCCF